jgi:hypothetical protein
MNRAIAPLAGYCYLLVRRPRGPRARLDRYRERISNV